jgi:hypothetical protein
MGKASFRLYTNIKKSVFICVYLWLIDFSQSLDSSS